MWDAFKPPAANTPHSGAPPPPPPLAAPPSPVAVEAPAVDTEAERSNSELEREMADAEAEILGAATPVEEMAAPLVSSQDALTKARTETERKERQIKRSLSSQRDRIRKESARLALFDGELAKLKQKEAADVADLRYKLEEADRDLVWLERDFKTKEAAYALAKEAFETASGRKREIKESMTLLVLNSERRKEEKLNELMAKMDAADDAP
jgi:hypothetical protein